MMANSDRYKERYHNSQLVNKIYIYLVVNPDKENPKTQRPYQVF